MKRIFLAVCALLLVVACDARPTITASVAPVASKERTRPVIAVSGAEIRINGAKVWLGDTMNAWKRTLGGTPTCYDGGILTCTWHANGLALGTDHIDKTRVKFMNLHLTIKPPELGDRAPSFPTSPFGGTLELDGIPIYPDTIFREFRRTAPPARELRCGNIDCGHPSAAFSDSADIYMHLDGRSEDSRVVHFSISCNSTASCVALMPGQVKK
ncbi:MAG: hypothetical protein WKG03_11140 [Telluria sp.]